MSKIDFIRGEMMAAMKAGDKKRKNVLSSLLSALKNAQIDKKDDLTEDEENQVTLKLIRQSRETLDMTPADRPDIIEECGYTISVLEEYAPKMMDKGEIKGVIEETLKELGIEELKPVDKGKIMKTLMPKVKGKADGKLVNETLEEMLS